MRNSRGGHGDLRSLCNRRDSRNIGGGEAADYHEKQGSCTIGVEHNGGIISSGVEIAYNFNMKAAISQYILDAKICL